MKIYDIKRLLNAENLYGEDELLEAEVNSACASDMMSDVLAFVKDQAVLITGLCNPQVIRTAVMMDMVCVVIVRGKTPDESVLNLAKERKIVLLKSPYKMFQACGILYANGLKPGE